MKFILVLIFAQVTSLLKITFVKMIALKDKHLSTIHNVFKVVHKYKETSIITTIMLNTMPA